MSAFSEFAFNPSINGLTDGSDDSFNVPGSTKLDLSLDTGAPRRIEAGDASGFSAIPTLPQLTASSGLNQLYGYYNRRAQLYNNAFAGDFTGSLPIMSYLVTGVKITASHLISLATNIALLRGREGFDNFSVVWPSGNQPTATKKIFGYHLATLRKYLSISGQLSLQYQKFNSDNWQVRLAQYNRTDKPYGTLISQNTTLSTTSIFVGKVGSGGTIMNRHRYISSYNLPSWMSNAANAASAIIQLGISTFHNEIDTIWSLEIASYNSDKSAAVIADFSLIQHFEFLVAILAVGTSNISVSKTNIANRSGGRISYLFVNTTELAGTGAATSGLNLGSYLLANSKMVFNF